MGAMTRDEIREAVRKVFEDMEREAGVCAPRDPRLASAARSELCLRMVERHEKDLHAHLADADRAAEIHKMATDAARASADALTVWVDVLRTVGGASREG